MEMNKNKYQKKNKKKMMKTKKLYIFDFGIYDTNYRIFFLLELSRYLETQ